MLRQLLFESSGNRDPVQANTVYLRITDVRIDDWQDGCGLLSQFGLVAEIKNIVLMTKILHITNGDSAVSVLQAANIEGKYLPWRDVLHDGPVPGGLSLEKLSEVRAKFIAETGWGDLAQVDRDFKRRDNILRNYRDYQKVLLWFEHDLYDQLQILQILDCLASEPIFDVDIGLICTENYLGHRTPDSIAELMEFEQEVDESQLQLAERAWRAFRAATPLQWFDLLQQDTTALPFLGDAVLRMLEEYPDYSTGLTKTELRLMGLLDSQTYSPAELFGQNQNLEQRVYLGDLSFWEILKGLFLGAEPLIEWANGVDNVLSENLKSKLQITDNGRAVLSAECNRLDIYRPVRWHGGVKPGRDFTWCWNASAAHPQKRPNETS